MVFGPDHSDELSVLNSDNENKLPDSLRGVD